MKELGGVASGLCRAWVVAVVSSHAAYGCGDSGSKGNEVQTPDAGAAEGMGGSSGAAGGPGTSNAGAGIGGGGSGGFAGAPGNPECAPGTVRECTFDFLCAGQQTCGTDGSFGACECGDEPADGTGVIGAECGSDADCGAGGVCFTATGNQYLGGGGPAHGYCTAACVTDAECTALDPISRCVGIGPGGADHCIRLCESKDPEPGEAKCLNRPDLMCLSIAADGAEPFGPERQDGVCIPRCGSDADCPADRTCDRQAGTCRDVPNTGATTGARCTLTGDCEGSLCLDRDDENVGTCSAQCTLGSLGGCGFAKDAPVREAACVAPLLSSGGFSEGAGDVGVCQEMCDVAADCQRADEGWTCATLTEALAAFFGRSGACVPPADGG